jgi:hypothetical protein
MKEKPKMASGEAQREIDKVEQQFENFETQAKKMTLDIMNQAPVEQASVPKLSAKEIEKSNEIYLKPARTVPDRQKFNEKFRGKWEHAKEYVRFIARHNEIIGDTIEIWTHPFGGVGAQFWQVPTNKPVYGPRYLAQQIKNCRHHRLIMEDTPTQRSNEGIYYGTLAVETTIQRLDAEPVSEQKNIFMNASNF